MAKPKRNEPLVPTFAVKLNGRTLTTDVALWIVNVVVEDDLDAPSMFTIELISKSDEKSVAAWTDDARLDLGATVEVSMGYGDDRESLIVGEIAGIEPTFSIAGPPTLIVRGFDKRHRLNRTRRTRSFVDKKDSDIATQICSAANVAVKATDSRVTHQYALQADQSDFEFLLARARRINFEIAMDGETMLFRPVGSAAASVATLSLSDDLIEFRPRMVVMPMTELQVLGWDPKEKQAVTASAKAGDEVSKMGGARSAAQVAQRVVGDAVETIVGAAVLSRAEADQMVAGRFNAASLELIRGDGRVRGRTDVRAGRVIRLDGLGARFSGDYYVTAAVHRYSRRDGYLTDFQAQRSAS